MESEQFKQYLGDGVFVCIVNNMIKLTTENGLETTNTIYFDASVLLAFQNWVESVTN